MLAGDAYRRAPDKALEAPLDAATARALALRAPWKRFLEAGKWQRGAVKPDPRETLIKQYNAIPREWRAFGRALYEWHVQRDALANWLRKLESIRRPSGGRRSSSQGRTARTVSKRTVRW